MIGMGTAPEIDGPGVEWLNVDAPYSLELLRGKVVVLHFWSASCVNCMHLLPALKRIQERFSGELMVIGVHSPKFAAETRADCARQAIARYGVGYPVVHDQGMAIAHAYGIKTWPTVVLVLSPATIVAQIPGEPDPERFEQSVANLVEDARGEGRLYPGSFEINPVEVVSGELRFPGRIKRVPTADGGKLWAIADTGHNQIVLADDSGRVLVRFGDGKAGYADGPAASCRFNAPQGLVCGRGAIFVADTFNHAIRRIDLIAGETSTLAGTGDRGSNLSGETPARETALASVRDLELDGDRLIFANAGTNQLGALDLAAGAVRPFAGSGGEGIDDAATDQALLAQPSGLALSPDGGLLAFVDAGSSSVRCLGITGEARVETLVGSGLLDFGDTDGPLDQARMQRPLALDWWDETTLLVADCYNDRVRLLDLAADLVRDLDPGDYVCEDETDLALSEPSGIVCDGPRRVLVADSNNHRIVEYRTHKRRCRTWLA